MNREHEPILELDDVSLEYRLYLRRSNSLRDWLVARVHGRDYQVYRSLWAVKNLSLQCHEGERLGIMGPNGAGKTSLLRVIAGIFPPTQGQVRCQGRVVPLLELGLGFNGEMSAAENVVLASVLLGKTRRQARQIIPQVMEFAQLDDFLDVPVKYYSSGMVARLAFSIAMETDPDVLLLDEVFAVGDIHWIRQAEERIQSLLNKAKVVMMVSHDPAFLRRLCHRGIYLDRGQVRALGDIDSVVDAYEKQIGGQQDRIVDNREHSPVRLECTVAGQDLHIKACSVPLLGESSVGLYEPSAGRQDYLGYRRVMSDSSDIVFHVDPGRLYQIRLYRWTPGGESLEASIDVDLTGGNAGG